MMRLCRELPRAARHPVAYVRYWRARRRRLRYGGPWRKRRRARREFRRGRRYTG